VPRALIEPKLLTGRADSTGPNGHGMAGTDPRSHVTITGVLDGEAHKSLIDEVHPTEFPMKVRESGEREFKGAGEALSSKQRRD
jgi:hypothetical protein